MRYLTFALYTEGRSDHRFLRPLIRRAADDLVRRFGRDPVEIPEEFIDLLPRNQMGRSRAERIASAVQKDASAIIVLFVHADGGSDAQQAMSNGILPAFKLIGERLGRQAPAQVPVVPVRETEAWAVADPEAIRASFGITILPKVTGLPVEPAEVERVADPKRLLADLARSITGRRRRTKLGSLPWLADLGERVSLARLRDVPAYSEFETHLRRALAEVGCIESN